MGDTIRRINYSSQAKMTYHISLGILIVHMSCPVQRFLLKMLLGDWKFRKIHSTAPTKTITAANSETATKNVLVLAAKRKVWLAQLLGLLIFR
jgi:hypothetical protein